MSRTYSYHLIQDGMVVAEVSAPTREQARNEIQHYVNVYGQDGPVEIHDGPALYSHPAMTYRP